MDVGHLSVCVTLLTDARLEMLLKWKKEKELKKKMEMANQAKKKPFLVVHVEPEIFPFQKNFTQSSKVCTRKCKLYYLWHFYSYFVCSDVFRLTLMAI